MPVFRYQAIDKRGRNLNGVMPAHDESKLEEKLKNIGLWLTEAVLEKPDVLGDAAAKPKFQLPGMGVKNQRRELIDFCTLMTFQVRVGVPLVKALEVAAQDCHDPRFARVLGDLQAHLESGLQFHEALGKYPAIFSTHFVSVVRAGELSSKLPETFDDLKQHLEWVEQVVADVRQATLYPAIVAVVVFGFVCFLFAFIIPKFASLLTQLHVHLPLLTQVVLSAGDIAVATWWLWLPLLLLVVFGIPIGKRVSPRFALLLDQLKLRVPVFGELNLMLALSKFTHNLSILYRAGIPILEALKLCQRGLIGNAVVEKAVGEVERDVATGSTISEAMHRQPVFSAMLLRMVTMGETTGTLDKALDNVSDYYNDIIPRRIKKVFSYMEPALMLFLIFIVGAVALAIYLPIITMMGSIR